MRICGWMLSIGLAVVATASFGRSLPNNQMSHPFSGFMQMSEEDFSQAIDRVAALYRDVIAAHGVELEVVKNWDSNVVNAFADQKEDRWVVSVFGGLARDPEMTLDGLMFVVCHEFGHHLAGFPFYVDLDWASAEGEADYFAAQVCARELWANDMIVNATAVDRIDGRAQRLCDQAWRSESERHLCYRTVLAGYPLAAISSRMAGEQPPQVDIVDENTVSQTDPYHPRGQCRLDTVVSASACVAEFDKAIIPGRLHPDGQDSAAAEAIAADYSCLRQDTYDVGFRPRCWFKSKLED